MNISRNIKLDAGNFLSKSLRKNPVLQVLLLLYSLLWGTGTLIKGLSKPLSTAANQELKYILIASGVTALLFGVSVFVIYSIMNQKRYSGIWRIVVHISLFASMALDFGCFFLLLYRALYTGKVQPSNLILTLFFYALAIFCLTRLMACGLIMTFLRSNTIRSKSEGLLKFFAVPGVLSCLFLAVSFVIAAIKGVTTADFILTNDLSGWISLGAASFVFVGFWLLCIKISGRIARIFAEIEEAISELPQAEAQPAPAVAASAAVAFRELEDEDDWGDVSEDAVLEEDKPEKQRRTTSQEDLAEFVKGSPEAVGNSAGKLSLYLSAYAVLLFGSLKYFFAMFGLKINFAGRTPKARLQKLKDARQSSIDRYNQLKARAKGIEVHISSADEDDEEPDEQLEEEEIEAQEEPATGEWEIYTEKEQEADEREPFPLDIIEYEAEEEPILEPDKEEEYEEPIDDEPEEADETPEEEPEAEPEAEAFAIEELELDVPEPEELITKPEAPEQAAQTEELPAVTGTPYPTAQPANEAEEEAKEAEAEESESIDIAEVDEPTVEIELPAQELTEEEEPEEEPVPDAPAEPEEAEAAEEPQGEEETEPQPEEEAELIDLNAFVTHKRAVRFGDYDNEDEYEDEDEAFDDEPEEEIEDDGGIDWEPAPAPPQQQKPKSQPKPEPQQQPKPKPQAKTKTKPVCGPVANQGQQEGFVDINFIAEGKKAKRVRFEDED